MVLFLATACNYLLRGVSVGSTATRVFPRVGICCGLQGIGWYCICAVEVVDLVGFGAAKRPLGGGGG